MELLNLGKKTDLLNLAKHYKLSEKKSSMRKHEINSFPNKPWSLHVCSTSLLKTLREKEKLLVTSNFSFSHSVFYRFGELCVIFIKFEIVVCQLFQFGKVQKFVVWERVKNILVQYFVDEEIFNENALSLIVDVQSVSSSKELELKFQIRQLEIQEREKEREREREREREKKRREREGKRKGKRKGKRRKRKGKRERRKRRERRKEKGKEKGREKKEKGKRERRRENFN